MNRLTIVIVMLIAFLSLGLCSQLARADDLQGFKDLVIKYKNHPKRVAVFQHCVAVEFLAFDFKKGDKPIAAALMDYNKNPIAFFEVVNGELKMVWEARRKERVNEAKKVPIE